MIVRIHKSIFIHGCAALLAAAVAAGAQRADGADSVIVSTDWLAKHLNDPSVVVVQVGMDSSEYLAGHIPGARLVLYHEVATEANGLGAELPPVPALTAIVERLGISSGSRVVLYADGVGNGMVLMASRAFFTLDYLGHPRTSILNGGITSWRKEKRAESKVAVHAKETTYTPHPRPDVVVDAAWVRAHLGARGVAFIDTRTDGEYLGSGERHGMPSAGHIPGAIQLQWEQLFVDPNADELIPRSQLANLYLTRSNPGDTLVTYCWVGFRASMTYLAARALGLPVKLYDGSYQDWLKRGLPVVAGKMPR